TPSWSVGTFEGQGMGTGFALGLGKSTSNNGENTSAIDLHLDLSAHVNDDLEFSFWFKDANDETHFEDGIFISDDGGLSFHKIFSFEPERWANSYGRFPALDLDSLIRREGLTATSTFVVRFQQRDENAFDACCGNSDGLFIDDIEIKVAEPIVYTTPPFTDNFDSNSLNNSWRPVNPHFIGNTTEQENITPSSLVTVFSNSGTNTSGALGIGKLNDNNGTNTSAVDLYLDFTDIGEHIELSFDIRDFFNENNAADGIYVSTDFGASFTKVYTFDFTQLQDNIFEKVILNLTELSSEVGVTLDGNTILRIQQIGTGDFNTSGDEDGLIIDNLMVRNFLLPIVNFFNPGIAPVGSEIVISGDNFDTVSSITLGALDVQEFIIIDDETLLIKIPENAINGAITVTNDEGKGSSEEFFIISNELVQSPKNLEAGAKVGFIQLTWEDASDNELEFLLERSVGDDDSFMTLAYLQKNSTGFSDGNVITGTTYFYRVRALNHLGISEFSNTANATAIGEGATTEAPDTPDNFTASSVDGGDTAIDLSWADNSENEENFVVLRALNQSGPFAIVVYLDANTTSYQDIGLAFATTYHYKVAASNEAGMTESTVQSATTVGKITAVDNELNHNSNNVAFSIYPIPSMDKLLNVDIPSSILGKDAQIKIYNLQGSLKYSQNIQLENSLALDLNGLNSGIYLFMLNTDEHIFNSKLVLE
ncbi:MAG: T9SS type A sorting domain-containing protein, partial [Cyclobacteriaceae bacterium]